MVAQKEGLSGATDPRRRFGDKGEDLAAAFFISRGFSVVERNWSCRLGEIDLIVERGGVTHFVEVKTRRSLTFGYPEESITPTKLKHLSRAIEIYLRDKNIQNYRVDALAIIAESGKRPEYHYVENIL
ncbi:MAG: YraN family protein [Patescibacteria group bacterium]